MDLIAKGIWQLRQPFRTGTDADDLDDRVDAISDYIGEIGSFWQDFEIPQTRPRKGTGC